MRVPGQNHASTACTHTPEFTGSKASAPPKNAHGYGIEVEPQRTGEDLRVFEHKQMWRCRVVLDAHVPPSKVASVAMGAPEPRNKSSQGKRTVETRDADALTATTQTYSRQGSM